MPIRLETTGWKWEFPKTRGTLYGIPYFGVLIIRILLFGTILGTGNPQIPTGPEDPIVVM